MSGPWASVAELKAATRARKRANPERGDYFGPEETRFFGSVYGTQTYGGRYFVVGNTPPHDERRWTVLRATDEPDFDRVGPSPSEAPHEREQAEELAARLAAAEAAGRLSERADRHERFAPCSLCRGKDYRNWATFVYLLDEPFDVCADCLAELE